jgi:hypothetical protein
MDYSGPVLISLGLLISPPRRPSASVMPTRLPISFVAALVIVALGGQLLSSAATASFYSHVPEPRPFSTDGRDLAASTANLVIEPRMPPADLAPRSELIVCVFPPQPTGIAPLRYAPPCPGSFRWSVPSCFLCPRESVAIQ